MFSSSIPVRGTNDWQVSMPSSFKSACSVPSPFMMTASGSSMESSSQRSKLFSIILTFMPREMSCFAR